MGVNVLRTGAGAAVSISWASASTGEAGGVTFGAGLAAPGEGGGADWLSTFCGREAIGGAPAAAGGGASRVDGRFN